MCLLLSVKHRLSDHRIKILFTLKVNGKVELLASCRTHNSAFLVLANLLFEKVGLSLQGNHVHKVERVSDVPVLVKSKLDEQTIGYELNVSLHEVDVHSWG
jgi:hypothetical protein